MPADITDSSTFTDPVQTPVNGEAANGDSFLLAPQGLANRTRWLKDQLDGLFNASGTATNVVIPAAAFANHEASPDWSFSPSDEGWEQTGITSGAPRLYAMCPIPPLLPGTSGQRVIRATAMRLLWKGGSGVDPVPSGPPGIWLTHVGVAGALSVSVTTDTGTGGQITPGASGDYRNATRKSYPVTPNVNTFPLDVTDSQGAGIGVRVNGEGAGFVPGCKLYGVSIEFTGYEVP